MDNETITRARNLMLKHVNKVPIVLIASNKFKLRYKLKRDRYLVDRETSFALFIWHVRQKITPIDGYQGLFFFTESGALPNVGLNMGQIYDTYKNNNGILYLNVEVENVFG
jgi:hypothetical protein